MTVSKAKQPTEQKQTVQQLEQELEVWRHGPSCWSCGDSGDVHQLDGEWLGKCDCLASQLIDVTRERDQLKAKLAELEATAEPAAWANDQQLLLCSKSPREVQPNNPMMHDLPRNIAGSALKTDYCNTPLYTSPPDTGAWRPLELAGQIQQGDWLSFTVAGSFFCAQAKLIIYPGTDKEEIVYNRQKNQYFVTSMAVDGTSTHKGVLVARQKNG